MNTSVAGFSTGLATQYVTLALADARALYSPTATGAAQQVHIMPGSAASVATRWLPRRERPRNRTIQSGGSRICTSEPSTMPSTAAFQIAKKYTCAYCHIACHGLS